MTVALTIVLVAIAAAVGYLAGRTHRRTLVEEAATRSLEILRQRQTDDDRTTIRQLPPTVTLADVLEHAGRLGIGATEAADDLYRRRVRALLDEELRREARRPMIERIRR